VSTLLKHFLGPHEGIRGLDSTRSGIDMLTRSCEEVFGGLIGKSRE